MLIASRPSYAHGTSDCKYYVLEPRHRRCPRSHRAAALSRTAPGETAASTGRDAQTRRRPPT
eukprot:4590203-Pyramimonas_sp.AAC.1